MDRYEFRHRISNSLVGFIINYIFAQSELRLLKLYNDEKSIKLAREAVTKNFPVLFKPSELLLLYNIVKKQNRYEGCMAEVGVYKGVSAKILCEAKAANKELYLFDTFKGLPKTDKIDKGFKEGLFSTDISNIKSKLSDYKNINIITGLFPKDTGKHVTDKNFCFVHLDVDLYRSTKDCLEFFYPRLIKGGIILSHDYHISGVKKAIDIFLKDKPEQLVKLPMSQCYIEKY